MRDQVTDEPIPFASIYTRAGQGTTSAADGSFSLRVSSPRDTVWIRCLGYQTTFVVAGKAANPLILKLNPQAFTTQTLEIRPPEATEILLEMLRRMPENRLDSTYMMEILTREYLKEKGNFLIFYEHFGKTKELKDIVADIRTWALSEVVRSRARPSAQSAFTLINKFLKTAPDSGPETTYHAAPGEALRDLDVLNTHPVRWLNPAHFDQYQYTLFSDVLFQGRTAWHIVAIPVDRNLGRPPRGEIWIDAQTFGIMAIEQGGNPAISGDSESALKGMEGEWKAKAALWVLLHGLRYHVRAYQYRMEYRYTAGGWTPARGWRYFWVDLSRSGETREMIYRMELICGPPVSATQQQLPSQYKAIPMEPYGPDPDGFWQTFVQKLPE